MRRPCEQEEAYAILTLPADTPMPLVRGQCKREFEEGVPLVEQRWRAWYATRDDFLLAVAIPLSKEKWEVIKRKEGLDGEILHDDGDQDLRDDSLARALF